MKKSQLTARDLVVQKVAYASDLVPAADGSYIKTNQTLPQNLAALDTAIHNIPAQTDYSVTCTETTPEGYAKTYTFTQCGTTIATVNIPKDMVVSSGQIVNKSEAGAWGPAGKYLELTLANATSDKVYIAVADLVDTYTAAQGATQVQLAISAENEISATIVAGSITATELAANAVTTAKILDANVTKAKLDASVQASLDLADSALQQHQDISGKADKSEMTVTPGTGANADKTTIQLKSGTSATVLTAHQDISGKADASDLTAHTGDTDIHVTTADKAAWNGAVTTLGTHTADTTVHITAAERTAWNAKYDLPSGGITTADLAAGVVTSLGKADTALQTSDLDGDTIENDATAGVRVKAGSITATHLDAGVNASLDKADTAYQKPTTGIGTSDLSAGVVASLGKADTALQASDITGKADKVANATSGNFAGLDANGNLTDSGKKAADFATAAQGAKADTAVQPGDLGNVAPTSADNSTVEVSGTTLQVKDGGITTAKLATLTSFQIKDVANDGSIYVNQVYTITIDHGVLTVTPV